MTTHTTRQPASPSLSSPEAEMAVLGSMILDPRIIGDVLELVHAESFVSAAHQAIFGVLAEAYERGKPMDMVQLHERLRDQGILDSIGGVDYLISLAESVPSAASATYYAGIVRDKAILRQAFEIADAIQHKTREDPGDIDGLLDLAEQRIFSLRSARDVGAKAAATLAELVQKQYDEIAAMSGTDQHMLGLPTGLRDLDEMLLGLHPGDLVIVAGRPSMGKTALALSMLHHIGVVQRKPSMLYSMEMSRQQVAQRMLCSESGVPASRIRRNMLSEAEYQRLARAVGCLGESAILVDDTPSLRINIMRSRSRRLAARHDLAVVFVDYLQLMASAQAKVESRQQEVAEISRGLKAMARELNVPVICLSQLNRAPDAREDHRPRLSDLRESGAIEQDADVVLLLHREEYYMTPEERAEQPDLCGAAEIIIAKHRNGPIGTVPVRFQADVARFSEIPHSAEADRSSHVA